MITVSDSIKNAYNKYTTQRKSYIRVGNNSFFIQNLDVLADAYYEGNVIGNAIAKIAKFDIETEYVKGIDEFELFDGVWTGNQYEYVCLGTFKLFNEEGTDDFFSSITAYDKLIYFNKEYDPSQTSYPTTIFGLLQNICIQAGVELENTFLINGDQILEENLFVENESLKNILNAICQINGCFGMISNDKLKLLLKGNEILDLNKYQLSNPEYKRTTWSINQVILGMTDIDGEYVKYPDDEEIQGSIHKLVINDNPFVYTQELREKYIKNLYNQVSNFGYVSFETKWEGLPFIELGDLLNIDEKESLVLRYNLKSPKGLESTLSAPSIIDSVVQYVDNSNSIANKQKKTEITVEKNKGLIKNLTQDVETIHNEFGDVYTKEQINELIQNAETGLTNTFTKIGGNNLLRNTGLYFKTNDVYDYWNGNVGKKILDESASGTSMLLKAGSLKQSLSLANGTYSVGFKYRRLNPLGNVSVKYNGREIVLDNEGEITTTGEITTNSFEIEIICDIDDSYEIWELMLNKGSESAVWSQSANEVHTDTVNISKGVTVEATENDTKATLGADGLNVVNKITNAKVLKATDTGIETTDIKATTGTIGGLMLKKVGNQTIGVGI